MLSITRSLARLSSLKVIDRKFSLLLTFSIFVQSLEKNVDCRTIFIIRYKVKKNTRVLDITIFKNIPLRKTKKERQSELHFPKVTQIKLNVKRKSKHRINHHVKILRQVLNDHRNYSITILNDLDRSSTTSRSNNPTILCMLYASRTTRKVRSPVWPRPGRKWARKIRLSPLHRHHSPC